MTRTLRPRIAWPEFWIGLALVAFRLATCPAERLWKDWLLLLGLFGLARAFLSRDGHLAPVATSLMAYFLAIHVAGQLPHALAVLGIRG